MTPDKVFRSLHAGPELLILPNAWDGGSARVIEVAGAKAIATSSAAVAWAMVTRRAVSPVRAGHRDDRRHGPRRARACHRGMSNPVTPPPRGNRRTYRAGDRRRRRGCDIEDGESFARSALRQDRPRPSPSRPGPG